jgi:hypothetical protein
MNLFDGQRFSKKALIAYCENYVSSMVARHKFDTSNGTSQLKGKDVPTIIDFAYMSLMKDFAFDLNDGVVPREGRFNRQAAIDWLEARLDFVAREHRFDPNNGWNQVAKSPQARQIAYGNWISAVNLRNWLSE